MTTLTVDFTSTNAVVTLEGLDATVGVSGVNAGNLTIVEVLGQRAWAQMNIASPAGTITLESASMTLGSGQASFAVSVSETNATPPFVLYGATHRPATTVSKLDIMEGTGDVVDRFAITSSTLDTLDDTQIVTQPINNARVSFFVGDRAAVPNTSDIHTEEGITILSPLEVAGVSATASLGGAVVSDNNIVNAVGFAGSSSIPARLAGATVSGGVNQTLFPLPSLAAISGSAQSGNFINVPVSGLGMVMGGGFPEVSATVTPPSFTLLAGVNAATVWGEVYPAPTNSWSDIKL